MAKLFEVAGYKDYKTMPIMEFVKPKKKILVTSYENGKIVKKLVTDLIYKGEAKTGYKVISKKGIFLGTDNHLLFESNENKFYELKDAYLKESFIGLNNDGEKEEVTIEKIEESFSILDLSVDETHTYYTAGLLSHNSFGPQAKALTEGLRKLNIICSNYETTMFVVSQERAQMSTMSHAIVTTGGTAMPFYASFRARVIKKDPIKGINDDTIGQEITVRGYKSKIGIPYRMCDMKLYFKGGFKSEEEYLQFIIDLDIVHSAGAWIDSERWGLKVNGRAKLAEWLKEHPKEFEEMKQAVNEALLGNTTLDANNVDPEKELAEELAKAEGKQLIDEINGDEIENGVDDSIGLPPPDMSELEEDESEAS
jgi:hypothetical protein